MNSSCAGGFADDRDVQVRSVHRGKKLAEGVLLDRCVSSGFAKKKGDYVEESLKQDMGGR